MMISADQISTELSFNHTPPPELTSQDILWAVPYGSSIYKKVNWWTGFLLSRYIDAEKVRSGETFLLGTEKFLPNKWTLVYSLTDGPIEAMKKLESAWLSLGSPRLKIFTEDFDSLPDMHAQFSKESKKKTITFHRSLQSDA